MKTQTQWKGLVTAFGVGLLMSSSSFSQTVSLDLEGMSPHLGQKLEARLISKKSNKEVDRAKVDPIALTAFSVALKGDLGESYWIDFYADLNENGVYDAPPTDHAWRIDANSLLPGMNRVRFAHNTLFTDIMWTHVLTFDLTDMTPHLGQKFEVRLLDINQNYMEVARQTVSSIVRSYFTLTLTGLELGHSYYLDFYADFNGSGHYEPPLGDHAWRMQLDEVMGDTRVVFAHNTNFTDIEWKYALTIELQYMNPHIGQLIELRVTSTSDGTEIGRVKRRVDMPEISFEIPGLKPTISYDIDFYADLNGNGIYDAPPTDHAWRESVGSITGNTTTFFSHNTNFTDIQWNYLLTFDAKEMTPHIGQMFELRVVNTDNGMEIGRVQLDTIRTVNFTLRVPGLKIGQSYNVDYYADLSKNGTYDAPTIDHAWRDAFIDTDGDKTLSFTHNTNFTDILWPTTGMHEVLAEARLKVYPNPFINILNISSDQNKEFTIQLFNTFGQEVQLNIAKPFQSSYKLDGFNDLPAGIYFLKIRLETAEVSFPVVKQ